MKLHGFIKRLEPVTQKLSGRLPLCPWSSVISSLDPRTLAAYPPPLNIEIVSAEGPFRKLRFADAHEAWFPGEAAITPEMWSEYLAVFWNHPKNSHYYLRNTPVKAGDVCVDGGACEGFFVFQALKAGAAKIICVEPSAIMTQCLTRTFEREIACGRVVIRSAALGAINGTARFNFDSLHPFGGSVGQQSGHVETVEVLTLERLLADMSIPRIDFLKMDIEGAEIQATEGALAVLKRDHPRLAITTYHRSFDFGALRALLIAAGYHRIKATGVVERGGDIYRPVMLHAWE
jgi:FkbM family methyltransferase